MRAGGRIQALCVLLTIWPGAVPAQQRASVTGEVVAADTRAPMRGAQVEIPALNLSAITDERGRFLLNGVREGSHTLVVSYLGYRQATRQVAVGQGPSSLTIELQVDPLLLDELVVVGYGETRRRNLAGSVASLRPEAVREMSAASMVEVMQGRMPGIQVTQNSGTPGAAITVRVRGASSISGGNDPLYVVDGVPLNQGDFSRIGQVSFGGQDIDAVSDLNPNEIESIEVLKDASAAAIYGSRASNGVVLVKTKRGAAAAPELTFGMYYGLQRDWRRVTMLNTQQYTEVYGEGCTARYGADCVTFTDDEVSSRVEVERGADTDWLSEVLRTAPMSSMDASVRGGNERVRYYVAGSSVLQEGLVKSMGYSRLNGRVNLDYVPFERLSLGTNVSLTRSLYTRARSDNSIYSAWSNALANPPTQPVYTADGDYYETIYANPVGMNNEAEAKERGVRILGNVFAQYSLLPGLTGRVSVGVDNLTLKSRTYDSPVFGPWSSSGGAAESASSYVNKLTYEGTLNFSRLLGSAHELSGVVGAGYEDNTDEGFSVQGTQFPTEYFKYITSAATISTGTSTRADYSLLSFFGRLTYTWNDRLTATFNVRRDGSSRFGEDNRYGTFPSASLLWRLGEEPFLAGLPVVRNLAVRASVGLTGNQQALGDFASRGLFGGGANYADQPGIAPNQLANPELKWERTRQVNLGTDFSLLGDRLAFSLDWYDKQTEDLLVARPVPRTTGYATIWDNVGSMQNRGFEVSATARLLQGGADGLDWTLSANLSRNRNEVLELYNDQPINSGFASRVEEGKPLGFFFGHVTDGIFQSLAEVQAHATQTVHSDPRRATGAGDIRFRDLNDDGVINDDDRTMIGSPWPDYEGGITSTLSYRALDLSAFVQFSQGNDIFNANRIYTDQYGSYGDNHTTRALERWRPGAPSTTEPRAIWGDPNRNTRNSDRFVEDGSYWRLKNIVLGCRLPRGLVAKAGLRSARVFVQGQNIYTGTRYSGFDPEVNYSGQTSITRGTDFYTLPQARTFTIGVNVGF